MYFKRLEVFGFKSFADKTVLNFEPGITAIIGPNGCGKSNIFDSIRWVLGEQSVKELRGSSMEDVIFNGTDKKPGLGFSEVSLSFSNESGMLPIDEKEVTITRRLFRSGESEYLLNKSSVRLKDINELFMGTGIGAEAYSLVQQGKVDLVVSAKPEERRIILDEAAGITKYKSKKKEALNKLKDTENNLLRINDIILEVKRQIATIERQANKARRYKEEFEKLKDLEVQWAKVQLTASSSQRQELKNQLSELKEKEMQLNQAISELNNLIEHETNLLDELEQKVNDIHAEEIKLEGQIDINTQQIKFNKERIEDITFSEGRITQQKEQLIERCRIQQQKIEESKQSLASLEQTTQDNIKSLQEKKKALNAIAQSIHEAKEAIQFDEQKILDITSKQVSIKNRLTDIMKELQGCLARKRRLEMENTKVSMEKQEVDTKLQTVALKIQESSQKIQAIQHELETKTASMDDATKQLNLLQQDINELEKKKLFLISQKEFIEKLQIQYHDIPDPLVEGRLITSVPPSEHHTGILGKVKEIKAIDELAKGMWKDIVTQDNAQLYEIICEAKFIELDPQQITLRIDEIQQELDGKNSYKESFLQQINQYKTEINSITEEMHNEEKTLSIFEAQNKDILGEANKLLEELELVGTEIEEVNSSISTLSSKEQELNSQLNYLNQDLDWCQKHIKEKQDLIAGKSQEREETTVTAAQLETEISSFHEKIKNHQDNLLMFSKELDDSLGEIRSLDEEKENLNSKKIQHGQNNEELEASVVDLAVKKDSLKAVFSDLERQKNDFQQRINSLRANVSAHHGEFDDIRKSYHQQELRDQEIFYKEKEIKDRILQTYRVQLDEDQSQQELSTAAVGEENNPPASKAVVPMNSEELVAEIERLRKRCESFGAVNLVAIEEFEQLKERFEFLTKQQSDLLTAKESLMDMIQKINRTTRQMFMDTFTKVSEEFRIYFRMLFGGGEAQLVLLDPENVLESGIEIIARPPGKKLQNISLLSGGEKSLTAIALVFGVFKVRPSPFCVLDEIDAALDESNVGRFSYLLKDFSKIAQFIVITHNKKTIASANVMYGITMQETGVSKIVSVKFSEDKNKKEEAVAAGV